MTEEPESPVHSSAYEPEPIPPVDLPPPKKKSNKALIIALIVLAVLCCCCIVALVVAWNFGDAFLQWLGITY